MNRFKKKNTGKEKPQKKYYLGSSLNPKKSINVEENIKDNPKNNDQKNKINEPAVLNENQKRDKIVHENNLKVIQLLQKQLDELESENNNILKEMNNLKENENNLMEEYNKINENIEKEQETFENLKVINDSKNKEYLHLLHLKNQQTQNQENNSINTNSINNTESENEHQNEDPLSHFTLGEVMESLLRISRIERERENNRSLEGPPMTQQQINSIPSFNYPRQNNNDEKCVICGFDFCFNDYVSKLKCRHMFHKTCLANRLIARQSSKCPICRVSII